MILLVIGDFHIPDREKKVPGELWEEIQSSKFDLILCTGDLTDPKLLDKLESIAPTKIVNGNMDYYFGLRNLPRSQVVSLSKSKIGLIHGNGIRPRGNPDQLSRIAREMGVDVLISGHVHALSIRLHNEILLLNPGSATGSWGGGPSNKIPSFSLIEEIDSKLKVISVLFKRSKLSRQIYLYDLNNHKLL